MSLKIAFLLFACCTLVMAQSSNTDSTRDVTLSDSDSNTTGSGIGGSGLRGFGNRFRNAFNRTHGEERDSVADSWNNVKDLMIQKIQTDSNLTKTGFDLGTVGPKFGKNLILASSNEEDSQ